jgi:DNA transformation protein
MKRTAAAERCADTPLGDVPGVGPKSAAWLEDAGVATWGQLEALGALEAYRRVKAAHQDKVSLNMLWGLQAVLLGISWRQVPAALKEDLLRQLNTPAPRARSRR